MTKSTGESSDLAVLVTTRMQDISSRKNQKEIAAEVGFPTSNVLSIIKAGGTKLSIDRVPKMAKALEVDLATLMLPALRQYYGKDTVDAIRDCFTSAETETEREILAIARKSMNVRAGLSFETREKLKEVFASNKLSRV